MYNLRLVQTHDSVYDLFCEYEFVGEEKGVSDVVDVLLQGAVVLVHEDVVGRVVRLEGGTVVVDEVGFVFDAVDDGEFFGELFTIELEHCVCFLSFGTQRLFCEFFDLGLSVFLSDEILIGFDAEVASFDRFGFGGGGGRLYDLHFFVWSEVGDDLRLFDVHLRSGFLLLLAFFF